MTGHEHTLKNYMIGFVLALVLTVIPFVIVWTGPFNEPLAFGVIAVAALIQVLVHLRYFLNLSIAGTPSDYLMALSFSGVLIFIMVGGTLWIMFDLYYRMM